MQRIPRWTREHLDWPDSARAFLRNDMVPVIRNLHQKILENLERGEGRLDMTTWHGPEEDGCGTTHCYAGWVTHLAGKEGFKLEGHVGVADAARLIIGVSCPYMKEAPDFFGDDDEAIDHIRTMAAIEAQRPGGRS